MGIMLGLEAMLQDDTSTSVDIFRGYTSAGARGVLALVTLLIGLWLLTGCATPANHTLNAPQNSLAECLDLASKVVQYPPNHARGRAARDRYLTMCLDSR
jgi:hypothetical protein